MFVTQPNGLQVMTDWRIVLNIATFTIEFAPLRIVVLAFALCTRSNIVFMASAL
jgi:hypothetical protein